MARLTDVLRKADVPERYLGFRLKHFAQVPVVDGPSAKPRHAHDVLHAFANHELPRGKGVALQGPPGRGKTALSCALLAGWLMNADEDALGIDPTRPISSAPQRPIYFTTFARHLARRQQLMTLSQEGLVGSDTAIDLSVLVEGCEAMSLDPVWDVRCLVLDDMGKEHTTKSNWAESQFDYLLRNRYDRGLPTIVTTNGTLKEWDSIYNVSMASFAREAFAPVLLSGEDRR